MKVSTNPTEIIDPADRVFLALGVFDGVHLGHQQILQETVAAAHAVRAKAIAVTFDPHPDRVVFPNRPLHLLQRLEERLAWIEREGIDGVWVVRFDESMMRTPAEKFVKNLVRWFHGVRGIVVGERFVFGYRRTGTIELLRALGRRFGFEAWEVPLVQVDGQAIRSSRIRRLVETGDLAQAERLLGHAYWFRSKVIEGDRLGQRLGFPTANLDPTDLTLPPHGVYAAWALLDESPARGSQAFLPAVVNIGVRPSIAAETHETRVEAHLIGQKIGLYGRWLALRFVKKIREEKRFPSLEALQDQIRRDLTSAEAILQKAD